MNIFESAQDRAVATSGAGRDPTARWELAALALLTLGGAVLRFFKLGHKSLWYDEAVIYHLVQGGWWEIIVRNSTDNSAPPLYPLLLGLVTGEGASEAALRSLSAVA